ncbi:MAG: deoxyhypusine hydroxylase [Bogoriella megaspora]|nr:MAG: deoxyhypusine hydroxylase [Bogoriella megaspora]
MADPVLPADQIDTDASIRTEIGTLQKTLTNESAPLALRFRALFALKSYASASPPTSVTLSAIQAIAAAFDSPSALLKHELAYCLGQTRKLECVPYLRKVLEDRHEDAMCRHEAAEALGALGDEGSLDLLTEIEKDEGDEVVVRETCEIAVERIRWEHGAGRSRERLKERSVWNSVVQWIDFADGRCSDFTSIDPAPPMPQEEKQPLISDLEATLLDTKLPLFLRYRAMFALRDLASPPDLPTAVPAIQALARGFRDPSALFRHEIAFVFGQLSHPASIPSLIETLSDSREASMVRHEAAEALGSLGDEEGVEDILKKFVNDPEQVVRESIIVALDMAEFEKSGEAEYVLVPEVAQAA